MTRKRTQISKVGGRGDRLGNMGLILCIIFAIALAAACIGAGIALAETGRRVSIFIFPYQWD